MKSICIIFQIHQPFHHQIFRFLDIGESRSYYDDLRIRKENQEAASNFIRINNTLHKQILKSKDCFKISFYISGTALDQFLMYAPQVIDSFRKLYETGQVEFCGGTASHSLSSLDKNMTEFINQTKRYKERIVNYFGYAPQIFVNTDLLFTNNIADTIEKLGYNAIITNGSKKLLQWRSPNYLYTSESNKRLKIITRNDSISNELADLLVNCNLTEKSTQLHELITKLKTTISNEPLTNIYLNYNRLMESNTKTPLPTFIELITTLLKEQSLLFILPSEILEQYGHVAELGMNEPNCWVENFHPSYFPGNELQKDAMKHLFKLTKRLKTTRNQNLELDLQYLQTSDYIHFMDENHPIYREKKYSYQSFYKSKYDAYINFMNILEDFRQRIKVEKLKNKTTTRLSQSQNLYFEK